MVIVNLSIINPNTMKIEQIQKFPIVPNYFTSIVTNGIQNSACRYLKTIIKVSFWSVHANAIPAKQRVLKLSHCYSTIYSRVTDTITRAMGKSIGDET